MNTDASSIPAAEAVVRVREIQAKLHQWAKHGPNRRFDDLYNLVCDPSFLLIAWRRVRVNRGARTAGVDAQTAYSIRAELGEERFLSELRRDLRARTFRPLPVRERIIPKPRVSVGGWASPRSLHAASPKGRFRNSVLK